LICTFATKAGTLNHFFTDKNWSYLEKRDEKKNYSGGNRRKEKSSLIELKTEHSTYGNQDFYVETVLRYKTLDGYTGSIVKIRSKKEK